MERSALRSLWRAALALTAFLATGVLLLFPFINASYEGRLDRDAQRAPIFLGEEGATGSPIALGNTLSEHLDFWYVDVYLLAVLDESADPPPGLTTWPRPGEVFPSQALLDRPGADTFLTRYGEVHGVIDPAGLAEPGERIAYVGVDAEAMGDRGTPILGFGRERSVEVLPGSYDHGYRGVTLRQQWRMNFFVGLTLFAVVPIMLLAVVSARLGGEARDRQLAVLTVLGADWRRRASYLLRETWWPVTLGAGGAAVLGVLATVTDWPLPFAEYTVVGSDLRMALPWLPVVATGAAAGILAIVLAAHRVRRRAAFGTRPMPAVRPVPIWPLWLLIMVIPAVYYGYMYFRHSRPDLSSNIAIAGAGASLLLIGSATAALIMLMAHGMVAWSKRRSLPALLVAGRDLLSVSRPVIRATIAVSAVIVIVTQVQVWVSIADASYRNAQVQYALNQERSLSLPLYEELLPALDDLPGSVAALATSSGIDGSQVVWGDCHAMTTVFGECPSEPTEFQRLLPQVPQSQLWIAQDALVVTAPLTSEPPTLPGTMPLEEISFGEILLFSTDQQPLSRDLLTRQLYEHDPVPVRLTGPSDSWLVGAVTDRDQGRWFGYGGVIALTVIFLTAGFALTFEMIRIGRRFASLSVLTGTTAPYYRIAAGVVGAPMLAAAVTGLVISTTIVLGPTSPGEGGILPTGLLVALSCLAVAITAVIVVICGRIIASTAQRWVTGREEP
jgi:hypothetical protein